MKGREGPLHREDESPKGRRLRSLQLVAVPVLVGTAGVCGLLRLLPRPAPAHQPALPQVSRPPVPASIPAAGESELRAAPELRAPPTLSKVPGAVSQPAGEPEARLLAPRPEEPPKVEHQASRSHLLGNRSSPGVFIPGKEVDGFRTLRLITHDPAAEAALLRGGKRPDTQGTSTDISRLMEAGCASCGRDEQGRFYYTAGNVRHTQLSYDQSKPIGERNVMMTEDLDTGKSATYRTSPLVFDLKGSGVRASDRIVRFNLSGKGDLERIFDIASDAGVLVFDADGNGVAGENGRELFGDVTDLDGDRKADGYSEGFEALSAMVDRARWQGVLPAGAADPDRLGPEDLAKLNKAYGLGMRVGGLFKKTVPLEEAGVREIVLSKSPSLLAENFDGQGDDVVRREGARFIRPDGSSSPYEDVFFRFEKPQLRRVIFDTSPAAGATRESPKP